MKKIVLLFVGLSLCCFSFAQEQHYKWGFGFYGEFKVAGATDNSFGMQASYDLDHHSSLQAQVFGRKSFVGIGADYLYSILNRHKNNFNVFLGAGVEENFYWSTEDDGILKPERNSNYFSGAGQVGVSYAFPDVRLSLYSSYKVKYNTKADKFEPNYMTIGVRYHLW